MVGERARGGGQEEEEPRFLNLLRVILQLSNALVKIFNARAARSRCDTCNDAILKDYCGWKGRKFSGREKQRVLSLTLHPSQECTP
jgi:hypothetical protein